jgi:hypothetical protein
MVKEAKTTISCYSSDREEIVSLTPKDGTVADAVRFVLQKSKDTAAPEQLPENKFAYRFENQELMFKWINEESSFTIEDKEKLKAILAENETLRKGLKPGEVKFTPSEAVIKQLCDENNKTREQIMSDANSWQAMLTECIQFLLKNYELYTKQSNENKG